MAGAASSSAPKSASANPARNGHPGDVDARELRAALHRAAEIMADYLEGVHRYPVIPPIQPGDVRRQLPPSPPATGEPLDRLLDDYQKIIQPNVTHWNHPGFMAYFPVTGSGPGVLGEALTASLNINSMLWRTGPAPTELEEHCCDWLRQMLQLPPEFRGHINDTASISTLLALAAARERAGLDIREKGMAGRTELPRLTVYCSDQAHSSVDKACLTLGLGIENCRRVPTDRDFRMDVAALERQIAADVAAGMRPIAVVPTVGTTSTTSVDPVAEILPIARKYGAWVHVDGAYAISAGICPEYRALMNGIEQADSIVFNPHKWMFVPVDCSILLVRDVELLKRTFSIIPSYLTTTEQNVTNLMDLGVQLGRRFRSLKLWMVLRGFGVTGLQERIRCHCALAQQLVKRIQATPGFELVAPVPFATVCFRATDGATPEAQDAFNERLVTRVNASGPVFVSHTKLRDRFCLRISIGNLRTTADYVDATWDLLVRTRDEFRAGG
jgi:aromatic-L-amino-acid decarboxylase